MNRKVIYISGVIAALGAVIYAVRRLTSDYASISSYISAKVMGKYFTISELCYSDTAKQKGIDNTPSEAIQENLVKLINNCLNLIRERYGKPIKISSGYRSVILNKIIGGVANSQHTTGQAADLQPTSGGSLADIAKAAIACDCYDQLIIEQVGNTKWIHVSYAPTLRKQILAFKGGQYITLTKSNYMNYL